MAQKKRRPTSQDATVRNVRASKRRDNAATGQIAKLAERVEWLEGELARLTSALRALALV